jgi:hypothetical protein
MNIGNQIMARLLKLSRTASYRFLGAASLVAVLVGPLTPTHWISQALSQEQDASSDMDPDVEVLVRNNPELFGDKGNWPRMMANYDQSYRSLVLAILALNMCQDRWSEFSGQAAEAERRLDLLSRAQVQVGMVSPEKMQAVKDAANQVTKDTRITDYMLADQNGLYSTCQQATVMFSWLNFAPQ